MAELEQNPLIVQKTWKELNEGVNSQYDFQKTTFGGTQTGVVASNLALYDAVVDWEGHGDFVDIQSAIDAGKTRLFVRAGTYYISTPIIPSNTMSIIGENQNDTILIYSEGSVAGQNIIQTSKKITIKNLNLEGNSVALNGIYVSTAGGGITAEDCTFSTFTNAGISFEANTQVEWVLIKNSYFVFSKYAIIGKYIDHISIINNTIDNIGTTTLIYLKNVSNCVIDGNMLGRPDVGGICDNGVIILKDDVAPLKNIFNVKITNNIFADFNYNAIKLGYVAPRGEDTDSDINKNLIDSNIIGTTGLESIYINRGEFNIISNNIIEQACDDDVNLSNISLLWCNYCNILNNKIESVGGYANIEVVGYGNIVVGNFLPGSTGDALTMLNTNNEFGHNIETSSPL
jgi:hypothetical protein